MPQYGITSGLPQLPVIQDQKDFELVRPLYTAMNALARQIAALSGEIEFTQSELAQQNQVAYLSSQNANRLFVKALVPLAYGQLVHIKLDGGKIAAELADSTDTTKPAAGIVAALQGIDTGMFGEVTLVQGYSQGIAGTAIGGFYWLGAAGVVQNIPPATSGNLIQGVGIGLGSAGFFLNISSQLEFVP